MYLMKVDLGNARTPEEEYCYWYDKFHGYIEEKLPWEMHPNEVRAENMYIAKLQKKAKKALDLVHAEEHNA